jgi:hypothetical protein
MCVGCFLTVVSLWAAVAAVCSGAALWLWAGRSDPQRWLRGAGGEQATAVILDTLPSRRWVVLHDLRIPGSRANIDHLVVGPTGVWVIDSKTTRATVTTGSRAVYFGDRRLDVGPLRWEATVVEDRLGVTVRPIVAVHGTGLRRRGARAGGVKVVPAELVARRIRRGRRRLSRDDVAALADVALESFSPGTSPGKRTATRV